MSRKAVVNSGGSSLSFVNKGSEGFLFYFSLKPKQENPFCVLQDAFLPVSSSRKNEVLTWSETACISWPADPGCLYFSVLWVGRAWV